MRSKLTRRLQNHRHTQIRRHIMIQRHTNTRTHIHCPSGRCLLLFLTQFPFRYKRLRDTMTFKENDVHNMEGAPSSAHLTMPGVPSIKGYRYPAPGSQPAVNIPQSDEGSDPYNTNYYSRDTRRNQKRPKYTTLGGDNTPSEVQAYLASRGAVVESWVETKEEAVAIAARLGEAEGSKYLAKYEGKETTKARVMFPEDIQAREDAKNPGSPGNKGVFATGLSEFDPSGLRTAMQTNWAAMDLELEKHRPTQLVHAEWEHRAAAVMEDLQAKGLPPQAGSPVAWDVPEKSRVASW